MRGTTDSSDHHLVSAEIMGINTGLKYVKRKRGKKKSGNRREENYKTNHTRELRKADKMLKKDMNDNDTYL